ncbi:hypothetical protein BH10PAT3_BH10PAT3_0050 [soil metagenome]
MSEVHHSDQDSIWLPEERAADYLSAAGRQHSRISRLMSRNIAEEATGYSAVSFYLATTESDHDRFEAQLIDDYSISNILPHLKGQKLRYVQISHYDNMYDFNIQRSSRLADSLTKIPPDRLMELAMTDVSLHRSASSDRYLINAMPLDLACDLDDATASPGVMPLLDKIGQVVRFIECAQYVK